MEFGAAGNIEVTLFVLDLKGDGAYVVGYTEFPEEALKGGTADKRLDNARDGAVASSKGKLKSEKKLSLNGSPGREILIESEKGNSVRTRIYAVKDRLYQTVTVGPAAFVQGKDASRFLDSFKFNP